MAAASNGSHGLERLPPWYRHIIPMRELTARLRIVQPPFSMSGSKSALADWAAGLSTVTAVN